MRRSPRSAVLLLLSLVAALLATLVAVSASAAGGGTIRGTVSGAGAGPLADVEVTLYAGDPDWGWDLVDSAATDGNGAYELGVVAPGTYRLGFDDPTGDWVDEFFSNHLTLDSATDVVVTAGASVDAPVTLGPAGHVTGRVTAPGGAPAADVEVQAYVWSWPDEWSSVGHALTGVDGTYDLGGVPGGRIRLGFTDPRGRYLGEYWDDAPSVESATDMFVPVGSTMTGKDAELTIGAGISGTVTGAAGPLEDVWVTAYAYDASDEYWRRVTRTSTAADGTYRLGGLPARKYVIGYDDSSGTHLPEFWDDSPTLAEADRVAVTAGNDATGKDAQLAVAAGISGTVTGATGPLEDVWVTAYTYDAEYEYWSEVAGTSTDADGTYRIGGLPTDEYVIGYDVWDGYHASEFWDDSPTLDGADLVAATAGSEVTGKDAQLALSGSVTGTVSGIDPDNDVWVTAWTKVGDGWKEAGWTYVDTDGTYRLGRLPAGIYRIGFEDDAGRLATEYWDDAPSIDLATDVVVTAGGTTAGRNASMTPLPSSVYRNTAPPTISGTPQVGHTLTASPGAWTPVFGSYAYEWLADGVLVQGATEPTLSLAPALQGRSISVRVTASGPGRNPAAALSAATAPVAAAPVLTPPPAQVPALANLAKPKVKGVAQVGKSLRATTGRWNRTGVKLSYQWLADGKKIKKATRARLKIRFALRGKRIEVKVTARVPDSRPVTVRSRRTARVRV